MHFPLNRPGGQGPAFVPPHVTEVLLNNLKVQANESVLILENILENLNGQKMIMPTIDTFVRYCTWFILIVDVNWKTELNLSSLTENSTSEIEHKWETGYSIPLEEFELQLRYDLAVWFMFANQYASAKRHLLFVAKLFEKCQSYKMEYCTISAISLKGFLSACQIQDTKTDKSLTEQMHESVKNHYIGFLDVLQEDNVRQEVPIHYREMAQCDLLSAAASGRFTIAKDLIFKVHTLNMVRRALADRHVPLSYFDQLSEEGTNGLQFFISVTITFC